MSEEEFLARWSRRKREARADKQPGKQDVEESAPAEPREPQEAASPRASDVDDAEPEFDLTSLPPIDSISAATDITAFLRKGIPQELTRAALRRAWVADPVIRDFVGLAENAWDFNDPNAMPGFGPLDCTEAELRVLVDRVVGGLRKVAEDLSDFPAQLEDSAPVARGSDPEPVPQSAAPQLPTEPAAAQPEVVDGNGRESNQTRRRAHGGALPR